MAVWETFEKEYTDDTSTPTDPVAKDVLDSFGIDNSGVSGGTLEGIDIKRADALSTLKASLLENLATSGQLTEIRVDSSGTVVSYTVGTSGGNISPYYSISASSYVNPSVGVQVTGKKPRVRRVTTASWYNLIGENSTSTVHESTKLSTGCMVDGISNTSVVTYKDPFRGGAAFNWNNGIDDFFEPDAYERQIGVAWKITPPEEDVSVFTQIHQQSQSTVPVLIDSGGFNTTGPNVGTPIRRKAADTAASTDPENSNCNAFDGEIGTCKEGYSIKLPLVLKEGLTYTIARTAEKNLTVNKFNHVDGLFAMGIPLRACYGIARTKEALKEGNTAANTGLFISSSNTNTALYKFQAGVDYVQLYSSESTVDELPCFQFANNLHIQDLATIGTRVQFFIDFLSEDLMALYGGESIGNGTVLALENKGGLLIEQLWAQVVLDTPSFLVTDPNNAYTIAKNLKVQIKPLSVIEEPSPIAINGKLIDQKQDLKDSDPTSVQDFKDTQLQQEQAKMASGRTMSLNLSSLDDIATTRLSKELYDILSSDNGRTYTHTCPPTSNPKVGQLGEKGGIVNTIEYSYTDQGSYLINVTEGSKNFGDFSGIDGGIYYKRTEDITTKGTVIFDKGNHIDYVVHVDGIGDMPCVNCCAHVLSVRDRVSIMIHNNEVEG